MAKAFTRINGWPVVAQNRTKTTCLLMMAGSFSSRFAISSARRTNNG